MKIYANIIEYPAKIFIQSQFMNDLYLSSSARFAQTKIFCVDKTWLIIAILREQHFIFNPIYLTTTFWHYKIYFNTLGDVMMIKLSRSFSFQDWAVPAYRSWYYSIFIHYINDRKRNKITPRHRVATMLIRGIVVRLL